MKQNLQKARFDLLHAAAGEDARVHRAKYEEEEAFYGFTPKNYHGFHTQNHHHQHAISQTQLQFQIAQVITKTKTYSTFFYFFLHFYQFLSYLN